MRATRRARARWLWGIVLATGLHVAAALPWVLTLATDQAPPPPDAPLALELATLEQAAPATPPHQQPLAARPLPAAPARPVVSTATPLSPPPVSPRTVVEPLPQTRDTPPPPQPQSDQAAPPPSSKPTDADLSSAVMLGRAEQPVLSPEQTWESQVLAQLERFKRYPAAARWQRQQDTVYLRLQIARDGVIKAASVLRSQGFQALDAEVIDMTRRAGTLPPPPADVPGATVALTIPVDFSIANR